MNKLAVFNLPGDCREAEVEDLFDKFGKMSRICVRQTRAGDTMAFLEFEDPRDAEDALRDRHGYEFASKKLRVEYSNPPVMIVVIYLVFDFDFSTDPSTFESMCLLEANS